jgi:hypothetical protein
MRYWVLSRLRKLKTAPLTPHLEGMDVRNELIRVINFIGNLLRLSSKEKSLLLKIGQSILKIQDKSGTKFTTIYLKEALRLVFDFLSEKGMINNKVWLKRYKNGLPKILGWEGYQIICETRLSLIKGDCTNGLILITKAICTVLSLFRAMDFETDIKLTTVTDPHSGTITTVDNMKLLSALRMLGITNINVGKPRFFLSKKGGANAMYAWLSIGLDLIAMISEPVIWWNYVRYSYRMNYYSWLIIFLICSISVLPLWLFNQFSKIFFFEG